MDSVICAKTIEDEIIDNKDDTIGYVSKCLRCEEIQKIFFGEKPKKRKQVQSVSGFSLFRKDCFNSENFKGMAAHLVVSEICKIWKSDESIRNEYNNKADELKEQKEKIFFANRKIKKKE